MAVAPGRYRVRQRLRRRVGAVGIARPGALAAKAAANAGGTADWGAWKMAPRADERQGCRYDECVGHERQVGWLGGLGNPIQRSMGAWYALLPPLSPLGSTWPRGLRPCLAFAVAVGSRQWAGRTSTHQFQFDGRDFRYEKPGLQRDVLLPAPSYAPFQGRPDKVIVWMG